MLLLNGTRTCNYNVFVGNFYELHTPDDGPAYQYTYNVLTTRDDKLSFMVKACNDAHIMLQTVPGSTTDAHFEIVIGGWANERSAIKNRQGVSENNFLYNCWYCDFHLNY